MSSIPKSKTELTLAINSIFSKLMTDYQSIPEALTRECTIEGNIKGTQISVCDTAAYLIGWGKLIIKWHQLKSKNLPVNFPDTGYKWNELGALAESFHNKYSHWTYTELLQELEATTRDILALIASLSNHELYEKPWYKQWTMGRMIQFNTSSPMKSMRTKVRRFNKHSKATKT